MSLPTQIVVPRRSLIGLVSRDAAADLRLPVSGPAQWPVRADFWPTAERLPAVGERASEAFAKRALLTLLFTDVVASTEALERLGDQAWCALLVQHHAIVRAQLKACEGEEIDAAGDGFFLTFARPSSALRFAVGVRSDLKEIGIDIRTGLHAGECELVDGRVEGIAVHTAARVAQLARSGEILVSNTVRDLLGGSGWRFSGGDVRTLKGLSQPRPLFALDEE